MEVKIMGCARNSSLLWKITVSFAICCFCLPAQAKYGGGTGEPNDPYLIYTHEQMNAIGADSNDWDRHFLLCADIDLSAFTGTSFNIIGYFVNWDDNKPFTGSFDGSSHTISNFTYNSTGKWHIGIFGYVSGENAEIKNLGLIDPNVDAGTKYDVGSLVGWFDNGTITNCYVEGGSVSGNQYVGGLVGLNMVGTIIKCYSKGSVTGDERVGGLVGQNSYGTITNCYATASVSGDWTVGGLVGENFGIITNCYSSGSVSGTRYVGGLVGGNWFVDSKISNCYSTGSVVGEWDFGGMVGYNKGTVLASFWDIETSGQTSSDGGTGKTTAEMQMASTYISWGCEPVWTIDEGKDYPRLLWENMPGVSITPQLYLGGGIGEPNDPYLIYTAEQLNAIGLLSCEWNKHFKLMADIDLSAFTGTSFNIIGTATIVCDSWGCYPLSTPFTGAFDGNGYIIFNFTYNSTDRSYIGLFGYVDDPNAEIKNLRLIDPNVDAGTGKNIGSLVGYFGYGTINDCYVDGSSVSGNWYVGGLVGYGYRGTITNCCSTGNANGKDYVGGLVGYNWEGPITNCCSTGNVTGTHYFTGGLVGYNSIGKIIACCSTVGVSGNFLVGGLVGSNHEGAIINSYSKGSVSGSLTIGGLVGGNNEGQITNCSSNSIVEGQSSVGGLVGSIHEGPITNCYSTGSVSGNMSVGGLVGYNRYGTITNCYSIGSVGGECDVGGLVGINHEGTITNCYSNGSVSGFLTIGGLVGGNHEGPITNCYATGSVKGYSAVGGLVGDNRYGTITNCYSTGIVSGDSKVGGLVGFAWTGGRIFYSFWDIETSGQATSAGGTGLSTEEMQMQVTFTDAGWDFVTPVWTIDEGVDYPRLWWEFVPVLHAEPDITLDTSNRISWEPVVGEIEFYAECVEDENFNSTIYSTGWITETSYEFAGLELGKRYWYSVKARNAEGVESQWSNVESSLQCSLSGAVEMLLSPESLKNDNMKNVLMNKIEEALEMIDEGLYKDALNKLQNDILPKVNGCGEMGEPDKNDWIISCEAQSEIYPLLIETIEYVKGLMERSP